MKKIKIGEEDQRLVSLAIASSEGKLPVSIGVPSPVHGGSPGMYFGAMTVLNWLKQEGLIDPDMLLEKLSVKIS